MRETTVGHAARCKRAYETLINPLRQVARKLGYAIGVHGSLKFDIDLIAIPWVENAATPRELAEAIRVEAERITGFARPDESEQSEWFLGGMPRAKPHGRLCWSFHLGSGPYIDLAIMPSTVEKK